MVWFNLYGLIIMIVIMIPNIVFSIIVKNGFENKYNNKLVETIEQIGRFGSFIMMILNIPFITIGYWFSNGEIIYLIVNGILTIIYCVSWIIFWNKKSIAKALVLSVVPSTIFLFSGIVLLNMPLLLFSILFSICHVLISYKNAR